MTQEADFETRLRIHPEPTSEELVAVIEALRLMHPKDDPGAGGGSGPETRWALAARRESLRPSEWTRQRQTWETGTR